MIITGKNHVLLNSVQEFTETEAWLLLTFFIFLHNQLCSIHATATHYRVQMFEISHSSIKQKINGCSFQQVLRKNLN